MNAARITELLELLGSHSVRQGSEWVKGSCPLAWAKDAHGGADNNPSFGVHIEPTGRSKFNCFTCHSHGDLDALVVELMALCANNPNAPIINLEAAFAMVDKENDDAYYDAGDWKPGQQAQEFVPWPEWFLDAFPSALTIPAFRSYLHGRSVTDLMIEYFDVRVDVYKQRVCFPFRNSDKELAGMRGRSIVGKKFHDYRWNEHSNIGLTWMNEDKVSRLLPVVAVEGQFDVTSVFRVYENVVGNLSSQSSPWKLDALRYFPEVIFFYDGNKPGRDAAEKGWAYMKQHRVPAWIVAWPEALLEEKIDDPGKCSVPQLQEILAPYLQS